MPLPMLYETNRSIDCTDRMLSDIGMVCQLSCVGGREVAGLDPGVPTVRRAIFAEQDYSTDGRDITVLVTHGQTKRVEILSS